MKCAGSRTRNSTSLACRTDRRKVTVVVVAGVVGVAVVVDVAVVGDFFSLLLLFLLLF